MAEAVMEYERNVGRGRMSKRARREAIQGYLFISPFILGFLLFTLGPMLASFYLSLTEYGGLSAPQFVGFDNYVEMFTRDRLFFGSIKRTFYYALTIVPLGLIFSFAVAVLLNQGLLFKSIYRTLFFMPSLTPVVALTLLWLWILQPQFGLVNHLLRQIGIDGPAWFGSRQWAVPSLILMGLWNSVGGGRMLIFLAALQGVPDELYEAATIDGANAFQKFLHVTLPMVSPALLFNLILGVIGAFKVFESAFIATAGGPGRATWFFALHIYYNAFRFLNMGYASALAWIFFLIVLALTALQFYVAERWVYYAGGQ